MAGNSRMRSSSPSRNTNFDQASDVLAEEPSEYQPKPCSLWNPTWSRRLDVVVKYLLIFDIIFQSIKLGFKLLVIIIRDGPVDDKVAVALYFGLILNVLCLVSDLAFFFGTSYYPWPFHQRRRSEGDNFIVCVTWIVVRGMKYIYLVMAAGIYFHESSNPILEESPATQIHIIFAGISSLVFSFEALWFMWIMMAFIRYEKLNPRVDINHPRFSIVNRSSTTFRITPISTPAQVSKSNLPKAPEADPDNPLVKGFRRKLSQDKY